MGTGLIYPYEWCLKTKLQKFTNPTCIIIYCIKQGAYLSSTIILFST